MPDESDAGPLMPESDAGPPMPESDAGPLMPESDAGPLVRIDSERAAAGGRAFRWLLVARNGRVLARGHTMFPDRSSAQSDFAMLTTLAADLAVTVEHAAARGGWRWRVDDTAGRTVLLSPRSYERYGTCQRAGRRILGALAQSGQKAPVRSVQQPAAGRHMNDAQSGHGERLGTVDPPGDGAPE